MHIHALLRHPYMNVLQRNWMCELNWLWWNHGSCVRASVFGTKSDPCFPRPQKRSIAAPTYMPSAMCLPSWLSRINQVDVEQRSGHLAIVAVLGDLLWQPPYCLRKHKQVPKAEPMLSKERLIAQQCRFVSRSSIL